MITWAGFLAKLFQFCIERIASKKVDIALDSKKRAAWAFFQLHRALATVQEACTVFLNVARPVAEGRKMRLYNTRIREIAERADEASEQFLSLLPRLQFVFDCYDHDLSVLLGKVAFQKTEFLVVSSLSDAFSLTKFSVELSDTKAGRAGGFSYSMPAGELAHTNWETIYSGFKATAVGSMELEDSDTHVVTEWPSDCLMRLLHGRLIEGVVTPDDINGIRLLVAFTEGQIEFIEPTLKALEAFIAKNFSIDDLLYVQGRAQG